MNEFELGNKLHQYWLELGHFLTSLPDDTDPNMLKAAIAITKMKCEEAKQKYKESEEQRNCDDIRWIKK